MSYDAIILLPAVIVGTLASLVALGVGARMRLGLAIVGLVVSAWVLWSGLKAVSFAGSTQQHTGWDAEVAQGQALWLMSGKAGAYLAWAVAPLVASLFALALWVRGSRRRWLPGLALAGVPIAMALWLGSIFVTPYLEGTWDVDDVRWSWGYYVACPQAGGCSDSDIDVACHRVEQVAATRHDELVRHVPADEIAKAVAQCRERGR